MCMQCMAGVMAAGTAVTSGRQLLFARAGSWLTGRRRMILNVVCVVVAVVLAATLSSSSPTP
jgi:hypothetical protein